MQPHYFQVFVPVDLKMQCELHCTISWAPWFTSSPNSLYLSVLTLAMAGSQNMLRTSLFLTKPSHFPSFFLGRPRELNDIVQLPYLYLRQAVLIFFVNQFELITPQYRKNGTLCLDRSQINEYTGAITQMNFAVITNLLRAHVNARCYLVLRYPGMMEVQKARWNLL